VLQLPQPSPANVRTISSVCLRVYSSSGKIQKATFIKVLKVGNLIMPQLLYVLAEDWRSHKGKTDNLKLWHLIPKEHQSLTPDRQNLYDAEVNFWEYHRGGGFSLIPLPAKTTDNDLDHTLDITMRYIHQDTPVDRSLCTWTIYTITLLTGHILTKEVIKQLRNSWAANPFPIMRTRKLKRKKNEQDREVVIAQCV